MEAYRSERFIEPTAARKLGSPAVSCSCCRRARTAPIGRHTGTTRPVSGATGETLALPLAREWVFQPGAPPAPGWGEVEQDLVWKLKIPFRQTVGLRRCLPGGRRGRQRSTSAPRPRTRSIASTPRGRPSAGSPIPAPRPAARPRWRGGKVYVGRRMTAASTASTRPAAIRSGRSTPRLAPIA